MHSAIEFDIAVHEDGGGVIEITVEDPQLYDSIARLAQEGAIKDGNSYRLTVDDFSDVSGLVGHLLAKTTQHLARDTTPEDVRQDVFERDDNTCILCGCNFDAPAVADASERSLKRTLDHIYPKAQANGVHRPHDPCNLATVCGGCDDVFLQGDNFRLDAKRINHELGPYERQLLAWLEKRALFRSDWLTGRLNAEQHPDYEVSCSFVRSRLRALTSEGLIVEVPHIASEESFSVFQVNFCHPAVLYLEADAVDAHARLDEKNYVKDRPDGDIIGPSDRFRDE
ncbi:hypothetical protein [Haloarcula sp. 1CSR25-25]|uniref:HNH endonuclease n=1 Tax=Haloarcula sp. 1CSR25-25 TaxID=2862545 RepID=UPI002896242C|nr:hypothetical protein [Haloarcula sp. 1CSR25-25]MDT3434675.1 hypothetical protein [Haloarcula sp. 1CSR25-25]